MVDRLRTGGGAARILCLGALVLFLSGIQGVAGVHAQDVSYTTAAKVEFGGGLGTLMRMVPGAQDEQRVTTHLKGALMRTDTDESSSIINAAEGRFTEIEHPGKTFYTAGPARLCKNMKLTTLEDLYLALKEDRYEVEIEETIRARAQK
ncbi:MAG: quinolinate synthase NadA, partial [Gemmatimonadota bacterium]